MFTFMAGGRWAMRKAAKRARPGVEEAAQEGLAAHREIERRTGRLMATGPHCPVCRDPMKKIVMYKTGFEFWGCSNYPACQGRRSGKNGNRYSLD